MSETVYNMEDSQEPMQSVLIDEEYKISHLQQTNRYLSMHVEEPLPAPKAPLPEMESLDYETMDSKIFNDEALERTAGFFNCLNYQRWAVTGIIGILVGIMAMFVDTCTQQLVDYKLEWVKWLYVNCDHCIWQPILLLTGVNVFLIILASLLCMWEPAAKGSGIPEVKCYLNGIKVPHVLRLKTLFAKVIGVIFSVGSGLIVGKEGPMIHSAAIIAGGVPQGKSTTLRALNTPWLADFRNDQEKRDFVSSGVAAGVSAAFGAPIGGVLFSLEEGSSFWNQQLTWRSFFCAMTASFTLNFFRSGVDKNSGWGQLDNPGLLDFGSWNNNDQTSYTIFYWPGFIILAIVCGLAGALFNGINRKVTFFRKRFIAPSKFRQLCECVFWTALTSVTLAVLSFYVFGCHLTREGVRLDPGEQYICPHGFYNDMASLIMTDQENMIKRLFHFPGQAFSLSTLCIFTLTFFMLSTLVYGCAVPGASFIPCLVIGAGIGRAFGLSIHLLFPSWELSSGIYAIIGAGAFLGGVVRMTIALTVILIETTGDIGLTVPFMITLMIAKVVADFFNEGLYDMHVHLKHIPMLEWEGPIILRKYTAQDVMSDEMVTFPKIANVGDIFNALHRTTHNGFPIYSQKHNTLSGLILRHQLITLLSRKPFQKDQVKQGHFHNSLQPEDFMRSYPRFPSIEEVTITEDDKKLFLDLSPYMNLTPHCIQLNANLMRVFRLFRTMGLRHLIVTDSKNMVRGMITRKDLVDVEDKLVSKRARESTNKRLSIQ